MKFTTTTVKGAGRGKELGFPTVNMFVTDNIPVSLRPGVYAATAIIGGQKYFGALCYGPALTFDETEYKLEIYLFDTLGFYAKEGESIEIETIKYIRDIKKFDFPELLIKQMNEDVLKIRNVLKI